MNLNKKVAFYTLGCKVNQYETESLKTKLTKLGYEDVDFDGYSDFYIVNSCTVTSIADKKTRNILRRAKRHNPNGKVIVTGCYAQTNGEELLKIDAFLEKVKEETGHEMEHFEYGPGIGVSYFEGKDVPLHEDDSLLELKEIVSNLNFKGELTWHVLNTKRS